MPTKRKLASSPERPLKEYRRKRNFAATPEPKGKARATARPEPPHRTYVIHKHDASRLHYDLRLELDGVLKSWAVPKGPSLDPSQKRLAVHVEDHPIEYASFEGIIPEDQYGGGTVMLWDQGWWEPIAQADPAEDYAAGAMKFILHGQKLQGTWKLVRFRGASDKGDNWLLIKGKDEYARPLSEFDILKAAPDSITTSRSLDQIASDAAGS